MQSQLQQFIETSPQVQIDQRIKLLEALLNGTRDADQALYQDYLKRARELELIVNDARGLQEQLTLGADENLGSSLASLVLRGRAAGGSLPIQLSVDNSTTLSQSGAEIQDDLEALIQVLGERQTALLTEAEALAQVLGAMNKAPICRLHCEQAICKS
ncbi:hypothetical protein HC891_22495 [Candidatus Gracilibacteria bacterium]|nr:hypothetical protein [Candidatus Gracilibacteria bacterium]